MNICMQVKSMQAHKFSKKEWKSNCISTQIRGSFGKLSTDSQKVEQIY